MREQKYIYIQVKGFLVAEGFAVLFRFSRGQAPFPASGPPVPDESVAIIDVYFVDDGAFVLVARTAAVLNKHIHRTVAVIDSVFNEFAFTINYGAGKTECILKYRGKGAKEAQSTLAKTKDASDICTMQVPRLCGPNIALRIVPHYKHLGSFICLDGNLVVEATNRAMSALRSFAPISRKIFGSASIALPRRKLLAWSLIMSNLFLNIHVWSLFAGRPRQIVNTMYNRVWHRIAGACGSAGNTVSNYTVRAVLEVPSVDCVVRKKRLSYLARIAQDNLDGLNAVLRFVSPTERTLP